MSYDFYEHHIIFKNIPTVHRTMPSTQEVLSVVVTRWRDSRVGGRETSGSLLTSQQRWSAGCQARLLEPMAPWPQEQGCLGFPIS